MGDYRAYVVSQANIYLTQGVQVLISKPDMVFSSEEAAVEMSIALAGFRLWGLMLMVRAQRKVTPSWTPTNAPPEWAAMLSAVIGWYSTDMERSLLLEAYRDEVNMPINAPEKFKKDFNELVAEFHRVFYPIHEVPVMK